MLASDHVMRICKHGQGDAQCRYLAEAPSARGQFACVKLNPAVKGRIDDSVAHGSTTIVGRADNCEGLH